MEWSERMNAAIDYIEENLTGEIDFSIAAEKAACSLFHFQRIFFAVNGMTPAEYARRRRLTRAARELTSSNTKVIDIALKYGYESPDAFTRAFRNVHGVTPQAAREPGVQLMAFPRISFHIILQGGNDMDYRIIEKPAFDIIGKGRRFSTINGENLIKIPLYWDEFIEAKHLESLTNLAQGKTGAVTGANALGVCIDEGVAEEFYYAIGIEKPDADMPVGYEIINIPGATWAIFEPMGSMPEAIQRLWTQIFQEWFPSTGYEYDNKPDLEVYFTEAVNGPPHRCQIWVPIIKKK